MLTKGIFMIHFFISMLYLNMRRSLMNANDMKNINYDLIKLLQTKLDTIWRLENFYINDAKEAKCHSIEGLEKLLEKEKEDATMLLNEIKMRLDGGVCDIKEN